MKKLFGTDGVRGVANKEITPELATKLGRCAARYFKEKHGSNEKKVIVIGKDTRISGDMIESALSAGILSEGVDVISVGVVPTPAMPMIIDHIKSCAGIMISASHNPYEFNGIKFFDSTGLKLTEEQEGAIEEIYYSDLGSPCIEPEDFGIRKVDEKLIQVYAAKIAFTIQKDLSGLKMAVDLSNGANYQVAKEVFNAAGASVIYLADEPDGVNINVDCGSTHLDNLKKTVVENKLDLGIAFDGDADRVLIVDENGEEIDGDRILLLLAKYFKDADSLSGNTVVGTIMSNMGLEVALKEADINFERANVGDKYVLDRLVKNSYCLGGEQSGHVIMLDYNSTGDGLFTACVFLRAFVGNYKKASEVRSLMKSFPQRLINVKVPNDVKYEIMQMPKVKAKIAEIDSELEGRGRAVLRASGTEPLLRVMVEAEDEAIVNEYVENLAEFIKSIEY